MSVRKRAINNRLARSLSEAQEKLSLLQAALLERDDELTALHTELASQRDHSNKIRENAERDREDLKHLAALIARHFTSPPMALSRESELFALVKKIAPHKIPGLPMEMLSAFLGATNRELDAVMTWATNRQGTCSCGKYTMEPADERIEDASGCHTRAVDGCKEANGVVSCDPSA